MKNRSHVFISYARVKPDEDIATELYIRLTREGFTVFFDKMMQVGTNWSVEIDQNLRDANYFVVLLSETSVASDMVAKEVGVAYRNAAAGRLTILPIRIDYAGVLPFDFGGYLDRLQYATWHPPVPYRAISEEVVAAIKQHQSSESSIGSADTFFALAYPQVDLPGAAEIEQRILMDNNAGREIAACFMELDHFDDFREKYGHDAGADVVRLTARIISDAIRATNGGYAGHLGKDEFLFSVPYLQMAECCELIIEVFDELIPFQFTEEDRKAGYFLSKDRRGNVAWVPMLTISMGVVSNATGSFLGARELGAQISEMRDFARKLPGSVYAVDRRSADTLKPSEGELA